MSGRGRSRVPAALRSVALVAGTVAVGGGLFAWKYVSAQGAAGGAAAQAEPAEVVTEAVAVEREHRGATTSIGTVLATRSITLRNEVPGTVRVARLVPGQVVDAGRVLVALDVSVEEAELKALEARAELAQTTLERQQRMAERRAVSAMDLDNARAARDVALAEIERTRAIIARKTIRAPFRAVVGIADVHAGQFLEAGALLTTLQGVDDAANVDFAVAQTVAAGLRPGDRLDVFAGSDETTPLAARIVAVDARVDPSTRNAMVRARVDDGAALAPGASVRVRVPVGAAQTAVVVPVSALRKGPQGDHVFVLAAGPTGEVRAHVRPVQAGPVLGDEVVILDGLTAGERLAATGSFKLRDGVLVSIAPDTPQVTAAR
ncbi:MAG TPA: efflux RND transporter periplasmic adaptor subunit [Longimicrobiales bacterium]|nr:efflux RND transporter periplasmic adaptor subunit [Longimicrobiales bacterium]